MTAKEGISVKDNSTILLATQASFWSRLIFATQLRFIKSLTSVCIKATGLPGLHNKSFLPTFKQIYPVQKTLTNRVFIPKSYQPGDPLLPLYINIHGGGFAIGQPSIDDRFCSDFANDNSLLVISLNYPKSPSHRFPAPVHALTDLVKAVLEDETLPFDTRKVAIGGFSAGANLSFAVCQDKSLYGKIGGVVSFYGVLDWTESMAEKLASRPAGAGPDLLKSYVPMLSWSYVNPGTNLKDPLLSVGFASQAALPPKIYLIGCEGDMFCRESEVMAERLVKERSGGIIHGDIWDHSGIKWERILGEAHGFDAVPSYGKKKIRVEKRRKQMFESAAKWLVQEVYA